MELIQIGLYQDTKKDNIWGEWKRKYLRYRNKWIKNRKKGYGQEWLEILLPVNRSEGKEQGENWFWKNMRNIQKKYPNSIFYYTPEICRIFDLAEYRKQWISWYFLFPQIWNELECTFQLKEKRMDMVVCDTKDDRAKFLTSKLIDRAGKIEICTKHPQKWEEFARRCYDEYGLVLEFSGELPELSEEGEKIIWDIEGEFYKNYPLWEKKHIIVAFGIEDEHVEYLRYRLSLGRVVYGYEEMIQEQAVSHKFASLFMQSINWRICQLARSEAIYFNDRDMWGITLFYQWKLKSIKRLTMRLE